MLISNFKSQLLSILKRFVILFTFLTLPVSHLAMAAIEQKKIVVLGDSLSAGLGMAPEQTWVALLEPYLKSSGYPNYTVINASISGDTTSSGLERLPEVLKRYSPQIVILELGANDGLRGLAINQMKNNLSKMIALCQSQHVKVLLVGMQLPPNYGEPYTQSFAAVFNTLQKQFNIPLTPFLLTKVYTSPNLMQADGIHPTKEAQPQLLENVVVNLRTLLEK